MSRLQLRLWASAHCSRAFDDKCILLEHVLHDGQSVVLAIDARGVVAVVREAGSALPALQGTLAPGLSDACSKPSDPAEPWPALQLHRLTDGTAKWLSSSPGSAQHATLTEEAARAAQRAPSRSALTDAGRRAIVSAIHGYYVQHVLEPSVAGFLSVLEKSFSRSDLYLFELLQNAVDENALTVRVELLRSPAPGLRFSHDGNGFTPLDVNGLASVGMSTKASKRAVGFMGIGFKACHKRFAHVVCSECVSLLEWRSGVCPTRRCPPSPRPARRRPRLSPALSSRLITQFELGLRVCRARGERCGRRRPAAATVGLGAAAAVGSECGAPRCRLLLRASRAQRGAAGSAAGHPLAAADGSAAARASRAGDEATERAVGAAVGRRADHVCAASIERRRRCAGVGRCG